MKFKQWLKNVKRQRKFTRDEIYIAPNSYIHPDTSIGKRTRINQPSHIGECSIGKYCAIGGRLVVRTSNHDTAYANIQHHFQERFLRSNVKVAGKTKLPRVRIGHAAWIGDSVIILPGGSVGNGAVIGAGSVVTKPIPSYSTAVGNPAKVIKRHFPDFVTKVLEDLKWWDWDDSRILTNSKFFDLNLASISETELKEVVRKLK